MTVNAEEALDSRTRFREFVQEQASPLGVSPVTTQKQALPLTELTWRAFEHLCCRIVERQPEIIEGTTHLYGVPGDDQKGIDIVTRRLAEQGMQVWCYQCKKHETFSSGELQKTIDAFEYEADYYVVLIASEAGVSLRDVEATKDNVRLWDGQDISRLLKKHIDLVTEFFGRPWADSFGIDSGSASSMANSPFKVSGTVYDNQGYAAAHAVVTVLADGQANQRECDDHGAFVAPFWREPRLVEISCAERQSGMSAAKSVPWSEATGGNINLYLMPDKQLSGVVKWCGSRRPIADAEVFVRSAGGQLRSRPTDRDGSFRVAVPIQESYAVHLRAPDASDTTLVIPSHSTEQLLVFYLARSACKPAYERSLVERICAELTIEFMEIPSGTILMGDPHHPVPTEISGYYIGRYPITCLQYSFYLQTCDTSDPPPGWMNRLPPQDKEDHPVTGIFWDDARGFCEWVSHVTGVVHRLPTEAEWEMAARGNQDARLYPWGDDVETIQQRCNSGEDQINQITPVDRYPEGRSPFGVWDMVGNAMEWTDLPAVQNAAATPLQRVARGGSFLDRPSEVTCLARQSFSAESRFDHVGFRVVRELQGD